MRNQPYIKKFENGILKNPITKENPYLQNPSDKGGKKFRKTNNSKSFGLLVQRIGVLTFEKMYYRMQKVSGKTIVHLTSLK